MVNEELIAEAKSRYLVGCVIKSVTDKEILVTGTNFRFWSDGDLVINRYSNDRDINWTVYSPNNQRWVDVISYPENYSLDKIYELWT